MCCDIAPQHNKPEKILKKNGPKEEEPVLHCINKFTSHIQVKIKK